MSDETYVDALVVAARGLIAGELDPKDVRMIANRYLDLSRYVRTLFVKRRRCRGWYTGPKCDCRCIEEHDAWQALRTIVSGPGEFEYDG